MTTSPATNTLPEPLTTWLDRDAGIAIGTPMLEDLQRAYGGDCQFPNMPNRPYVFANFVEAMDGVVSFQIPGQASGGEVSGFNAQDQFIMGVLRAAADMVMVGAGTLRAEPHHRWIPEFIAPNAALAWRSYRTALGKTPVPMNAFVTNSGDINFDADVFHDATIPIVICTTTAGAKRLTDRLQAFWARAELTHVHVEAVGDAQVDLLTMLAMLRTKHGVRQLLLEGGPTLMGDFVAAGLMDEIFLTDAPQIIGNNGSRPTWAKGHLYAPETAPKFSLVSLKGWGDYVFRRYRKNAR
ncbi:dihydrofolate reductase family protein [Candidatus Uhrbacteria bacterium]|nr:dihydrofolate reductase family protein [Candidatus Uhrbacteria bacterium]